MTVTPCHGYDYDTETLQPPQRKDWDCSAAATAWFGRSIRWDWQELDVAWEFQKAGIATPQLGLLDGTGAGIVRWLSLQPIAAENFKATWEKVAEIAGWCPLIMGSSRWYHWTGVRNVDDSGTLLLANSAPGWAGIWQSLSQTQFNDFGDFWAVKLSDDMLF